MKRHILFCIVGMIYASSAVFAQNWTVGQPVSMLLTDLSLTSDNCWNQGQQNDDILYFPSSMVTGVDHVYVMVAALPANTVGFGAPNNIVNAGDTIPITMPNQQFPVYFTGGAGGVVQLEVYAVGTPQFPGQNHPCAPSPLWLQNFLICNTEYNNNISTNCVTQVSTEISDFEVDGLQVILPNSVNGQMLTVMNIEKDASMRIFDVLGNEVASASTFTLSSGLDLNHLRDGIYFYSMEIDGKEQTAKFLFTK